MPKLEEKDSIKDLLKEISSKQKLLDNLPESSKTLSTMKLSQVKEKLTKEISDLKEQLLEECYRD